MPSVKIGHIDVEAIRALLIGIIPNMQADGMSKLFVVPTMPPTSSCIWEQYRPAGKGWRGLSGGKRGVPQHKAGVISTASFSDMIGKPFIPNMPLS